MTSPGAINVATLSGDLDADLPVTQLLLPNGKIIRIDTLLLLGEMASEEPAVEALTARDDQAQVIPLIEEQLIVGKRTVETAKVRLKKTVTEYQEQLNEPLAIRTFDMERVILNQPVETAPGIRHEGATTIYPVVEEQLIITRQLILKEELHVTQRDTERIDTQVVTLHREHLTVEREDISTVSK